MTLYRYFDMDRNERIGDADAVFANIDYESIDVENTYAMYLNDAYPPVDIMDREYDVADILREYDLSGFTRNAMRWFRDLLHGRHSDYEYLLGSELEVEVLPDDFLTSRYKAVNRELAWIIPEGQRAAIDRKLSGKSPNAKRPSKPKANPCIRKKTTAGKPKGGAAKKKTTGSSQRKSTSGRSGGNRTQPRGGRKGSAQKKPKVNGKKR